MNGDNGGREKEIDRRKAMERDKWETERGEMDERERERDRMITEEASTGRHVAWTTQRTSTLAELFVKPRSHIREICRLLILDENCIDLSRN